MILSRSALMYCNIHTHRAPVRPEDRAIISADIRLSAFNPSFRYAAGIHPWEANPEALPLLYEQAKHPCVAAIGETGMDKRNSPLPFAVQEELFIAHIKLAEALKKTLIIHCVKAWEELFRIRKASGSHVPWIIHGFRGNATLAGQLLNAGFYLSFGLHFRPEAVFEAWTACRLFAETDDDDIDIRDVYAALAASLSVTKEELSRQIAENFDGVQKTSCKPINRVSST
ncbi:MAG: TatD family hydrolase [Tannerella sp.]|jgi:TatD DNase family protein|nr:TatD family hydrolase [Tannerella sp.]